MRHLLNWMPAWGASGRLLFLLCVLAQMAGITGLVFHALGGWERDFRIPLQFSDDALTYLAQTKSTFDNGWWWLNPRQGAPFQFNALLFPSNSNVDQAVIWVLSRFSGSPGLTINLGWLVMLALSGATAAYAFRSLGFCRSASLIAATLFALSPYALYRNLGHFSLVTYLVPFPAALALQLAGGRVPGNGSWTRALPLLVGCALIGFNFVYYAFFGCFFIALGTVAGFWASRDRRLLYTGGAALATICFCVLLNLAPSIRASAQEGDPIIINPKVAAEADVYGLKIRQLVSPVFEHSFQPFRWWTRKEANARFPLETENMITRLGVVASLGFLAALGTLLLRDGRPSAVSWASFASGRLMLGGLLLATVGGFGSLFNLFITADIRAYNRIGAYLVFLALVPIAVWLHGAVRRRRVAGLVLGLLVLTIGVWDQAHALRQLRESRTSIEPEYRSLQAFVRDLERVLPNQGMVLQLPFTIYLNDSGLERMAPYDHFKPYLVSEHARWSYPAMSNRQFDWQEAAARRTPRDLAFFAASEGFAAILIDRYGYADRGEELLAELRSVPGIRTIGDGERYAALDILAVTHGPDGPHNVEDFRPGVPVTVGLPLCAGLPLVAFDRIGGETVPSGATPIAVRGSQRLLVSGWAVIPGERRAAADVDLAIGADVVYPAAHGFERIDVAEHLKDSAYRASGFRAVLPAGTLQRGPQTLTVRVLSSQNRCYYEAAGIPLVVH